MNFRKYIAVLAALLLVAPAFAQNWDSLRATYPWMNLRDSTNAIGLTQIQISGDVDTSARAFHDPSVFKNVAEYLERSAGLSMIGRGAFGKEPVLHGMNTDRVQVTIDGMPVMQACVGKMDPATSYVETNNLAQVDVENGGGNLALGSDVGGNLNFKTLDPRIGSATPIYGNAGIAYESNGLGRSGFLKVGLARDTWGLMVNGTYRARGSYVDGQNELVAHSQYNKANVALAGKWMISDRQVLDVDVIVDEAWDVGYSALPMDAPSASARIGSVEWKYYNPGQNWNWLKVKAFGNRVHHVMDNFSRQDSAMKMSMPGLTQVGGLHGSAQYQPGADIQWDFQWNLMHEDYHASMTMYPQNESEMYMLTWPDISQQSSAGITSFQKTFDQHLIQLKGRLEGSVAYPNSSQGVNQWKGLGEEIADADYRLSGGVSGKYAYNWKRSHSFYGKLAYLVRQPTVSEQYGLYIYNAQDGFAYLGAPNIPNEASAQATVGWKQKSKQLTVKSEGYYYRFWNYIIGVIDPDMQPLSKMHNGVKRYSSLPTAHMLGWTAEANYQLTEKWLFYFSAEITRGFDNQNNALPLVPPVGVSGGGKFLFKNGYVAAECLAATVQHAVSPYNGEDATPGYAIVNVEAAYEFSMATQKIALTASADNIANAYYWQHLDWNNVPQLGRNFSVSLNWKF